MSSILNDLQDSALVNEPKWGGGGVCKVSAKEYSCAHGAQINFGDLTPYLACGLNLDCCGSGTAVDSLSTVHLTATNMTLLPLARVITNCTYGINANHAKFRIIFVDEI
jgi:hypothetical protein